MSKIILTKAVGTYAEELSVGKVHINGPLGSTACGLALEDYKYNATSKPVDCETCKNFLAWAKKVAKINS